MTLSRNIIIRYIVVMSKYPEPVGVNSKQDTILINYLYMNNFLPNFDLIKEDEISSFCNTNYLININLL